MALLRSMTLTGLLLVSGLWGCRAPVPTPSPPARFDCPKVAAGELPIFPGARRDDSLAGETVGAAGKRYQVTVYTVAQPVKTVRAFYQKCIGEETSESEEGSVHYQRSGRTLTVSGSPTRTFLRITRKPKAKPKP